MNVNAIAMPASTGIVPSKFQKAIIETVLTEKCNLLIQACAGSGKTATLRMICEAIPPNVHAIAVCFNKSIQREFERKLPTHVEAKTLHGVGMSSIMRQNRNTRIEAKKWERLVGEYIERERVPDRNRGVMYFQVPRLCSTVLATLTDARDYNALQLLAEDFDIQASDITLKAVRPCIEASRRDPLNVSFDDMLDHPLVMDYQMPTYDLVLVDETQDLNPQQMALVARIVASNGRLVAVGDRNQAIYGFRGADRTAMDTLGRMFSCKELPLSYCYRCGSSIIKEAQQVVGEEVIQSPEGQHQGVVMSFERDKYSKTIDDLQPYDLIVCRTNAPLVAPCLDLIRQGRRAQIQGAEIGKRLVGIIKGIQKEHELIDRDIELLKTQLDHWKEEKVVEALNRGKGALAEYYSDLANTIFNFIIGAKSIKDVIEIILKIFEDGEGNAGEIKFSSIHRAKGLEANRVIYLGPELVPHPMAIKSGIGAFIAQEKNLDYVARTRAKQVLIYQELPK